MELKLDFTDLTKFDKVFISKVFTDTPVADEVLELPNVNYGGTGFFMIKPQSFQKKWNTTCQIIVCMRNG